MLLRYFLVLFILVSVKMYGQEHSKLNKTYHTELKIGQDPFVNTEISSTKGNVINLNKTDGGIRTFSATFNRKVSNYTFGVGISSIALTEYTIQSLPLILQAKYWIKPSTSNYYVGLKFGHGLNVESMQASRVNLGELQIGKLFLLGNVNILAELDIKRSSFNHYKKDYLTYNITSIGFAVGVLL